MKEIIFESSSAFILVCLLVSVGYAFLLYRTKNPWSKTINWILFSLRAILCFILCFLLLGPIVKQINNIFEKPIIVILNDDSGSIKEVNDSQALQKIQNQLGAVKKSLLKSGYEVTQNDLGGNEIDRPTYSASSSDLNTALKKITNRYEGQNVAGVILVSDGIYNQGISPLYSSYNFPVYTVGVGDTLERVDLSLKNIAYNKIAYQGNKFPVRVDVLAKGLAGQSTTVMLSRKGKGIEKQTKTIGNNQLITFDFEVQADDQGIQKIDIQIEPKSEEHNAKNNHASIFVEVVEGKKKLLLVAPAPHPDIKALREVIKKNSNYECLLHIPGLSEQPANLLKPGEIDLAIFLQAPDLRGKTREVFQQFANSKTSILLQLGHQSDLAALARLNFPVKFTTMPRDYDEVVPAINPTFSNFTIEPENASIILEYPPASVHFGKIQTSPTAANVLFQRVGSVTTDKPMLTLETQDNRKIGILLSEGIWRWRLTEFDKTENTQAFDELFGKLIQYLSTVEDKRKFRCYPLRQEFSDDEPVVFESQAYNDIFEPIFGQTINLEITDEQGKKSQYTYVTSRGNTQYQIGDLTEGVYRYKAHATVSGKQEEAKGEFIVSHQQQELLNLTADFNLLRKLSANTGGKFAITSNLDDLTQALTKKEARSIIHSEEHYDSLINLKWLFFVLLLLVSVEWFVRKYNGSY